MIFALQKSLVSDAIDGKAVAIAIPSQTAFAPYESFRRELKVRRLRRANFDGHSGFAAKRQALSGATLEQDVRVKNISALNIL